MRQTTVISMCLLGFLVGLVLSRKHQLNLGISAILLVFFSCCLILIRKLRIAGLILLFTLLGILRGSVYMNKINDYVSLTSQKVEFSATASSDSVYGDKGQLSFDAGNIVVSKPYKKELIGTIAVKGYGESMVYKGDKLNISGKIRIAKGSRQANISFAEINKIQSGNSNIDKIRRQFAAGIQNAMPEPLGSFGLGILIGQRTTLPDSLTQQISIVGLTHIVAVSGYNLTIMVNLAHRLTRKRSKYQSTILTLLLIGSFLLVTGFSASIVRASIVSILSLWAWYFGRKFKPVLLLLLSAVITAGYFPPYLWSDIGWHLSFLAFAGVLVLGPLITRRFFKTEPKAIASMFVETFSAQLLTLPLIMFIFGKLSIISLLANMFIIPLVPLAMGLCLIAGMAGWLTPALAGWLAWPANLLMTYIVDLIRLFAKLPKASIEISLTALQLIYSYILVMLIILVLWKKTPLNAKLTDRKQLV